MSNLNRQWLRVGAAMLVLLALVVLFWLPLPVLLLSERHHNPVLVLPLLDDKRFAIEYIHSVQKTPVQENFIYQPGRGLLLVSTTYKSLGAGLPFLPGEGQLLTEPGCFVLSGLNLQFEEINLGFMSLAEHALLYRGKRYDLKDYFLSGSQVKFEVKKYPPLKIIRQQLATKKEN